MNFNKLFDMQMGLDHHIETKHQLGGENLFDRKILALLVEVGELANETRCFKFWSVRPSSPDEVILEEFVDGVHFILSLGIECGFNKHFDLSISKLDSLTEGFIAIYEAITAFRTEKSFALYRKLFEQYLGLAQLLGFTSEQIEQAYIEKNEVNYERQKNGY